MLVSFKAWTDTKNVDLVFTPENAAESALLMLMQDRRCEWATIANPTVEGKFELLLKQKRPDADK